MSGTDYSENTLVGDARLLYAWELMMQQVCERFTDGGSKTA